MRPDTALFLERVHMMEQWDEYILEKKVQWEKVIPFEYHPNSAS